MGTPAERTKPSVEGHENIILAKAHDVRHLRTCVWCGGLGDDRNMVEIAPTRYEERWHPRCFFEEWGESYVLELRHQHQMKFRLCDIPKSLMKKLVDRHD